MTQEIRKELDAWMRPASSLVTFAKSLRMEGPGGSSVTNPSQQSQEEAQKVVDHFEGIELDELPENVRTAITNAKATLTQSATAVQTAEQRRAQAEQFARGKQSEADKLRGVLQHHNLADKPVPQGGGNGATDRDARIAGRQTRLEAKGLKPEAAKVYAEMLEDEAATQREELLREFAPLAGAVGGVQASQVLAAAESEHAQIFAIPEIAKQVRETVGVMSQNGTAVTPQAVKHVIEMAYGNFALNNPTKLAALNKAAGEVPRFSGGGGMSGGGHVNNPTGKNDGAPVATQPETATIMANIVGHMKKDLPSAKGAKK